MNAFSVLVSFAFFIPMALAIASQLLTAEAA